MSRRGYVLIEMIVAISLVGLTMTTATLLVHRLFDTANQVLTAERAESAADQATRLLRRDVEIATEVRPAAGTSDGTAGGDAVTLGPATWAVAADTLVRTADGHSQRFGPLPAPALTADAGVVRLTLGESTWTLRSLATEEGRP